MATALSSFDSDTDRQAEKEREKKKREERERKQQAECCATHSLADWLSNLVAALAK